MTKHLFLFTIGPVQAFIAQARRTQDLYIGSRMLSALAAAGVQAATSSAGFQPIFPAPQQGTQLSEADLKGTPHRFAFLSNEAPYALAERVEKAIRDQWRIQFAEKVEKWLRDRLGDGKWLQVFQQQAYDWLEFYWVALPYNESEHTDLLGQAGGALAQRKYARHFPQIEAAGDKCTLTGAQSALPFTENQRTRLVDAVGDIVLSPNERLGALAIIKRLAGQHHAKCFGDKKFEIRSTTAIAFDKKEDSEETERRTGRKDSGKEVVGYLAVLHMDGDRMGKHLSTLKSREEHIAFSAKLTRFATQIVPETIKKHGGAGGLLVYSGGDDVLALLPLKHALKCAYELYNAFHALTGLTASAGIAITPHDLPLDNALEMAREAEETAKDNYGRDAVVFTEAHGTGQMRSAGANWKVVPFLQRLQELFEQGKISSKLGYELQAIDHDLHAADMVQLRQAEILRVAKRRTAEGVDFEREVKPIMEEMICLVEPVLDKKGEPKKPAIPTWADMANWAILTRFLATDRAKEGQA